MVNNHVTAGDLPDRSYQCYGSCTLKQGSENNTFCGGAVAPKIVNKRYIKRATGCWQKKKEFQGIRDMYPASQMPKCPQYTDFTQADGYNCVDGTTGGGANW